MNIINSQTSEYVTNSADITLEMSHHDSHVFLVIRNRLKYQMESILDFTPFLDYLQFNLNEVIEIYLLIASEFSPKYHSKIKFRLEKFKKFLK